jgi:thiosulfate reductase/polysulfide reductase chain A
MAMVMDNPWIGDVTTTFDPYPMKAWINAETARKLGLRDGDLVWVESQISKNKGEIRTSQCVHPEVIAIGGCSGSRSVDYNPIGKEGLNINELCDFDETRMNPVVGGMENRAKVKVYKA